MKKFILMYFILFLIGCGGNSISSPTGNNSNTGNNTTTNNNSNKTESIKIKLKIKGESNSAFFVKYGNKYANEISIQANGKINTFKSDFNGGYYLSDNSSMGKKYPLEATYLMIIYIQLIIQKIKKHILMLIYGLVMVESCI